MTLLSDTQKRIDYRFKDIKLLETAFTHRSYLNENKLIKESNERLEFLGDAVLEVITSDYLYHRYPNLPEGKLTALRAKIVQTKTLGTVANTLQLGLNLKLSKGETASGGINNASILADLVEAIIGAIYIDGGLKNANTFINQHILDKHQQLIEQVEVEDWKSILQELVQAKGSTAPIYEVIHEEGPDHNRIFTVQAYYFDRSQTVGIGKSKQSAEQAAAKQALEKLDYLK